MTFGIELHIIILALRTQTHNQIRNALLAQLVEHLTLNQGVEGSNPSSRTKALFLVDIVAGDGVFLLFKSYIVL